MTQSNESYQDLGQKSQQCDEHVAAIEGMIGGGVEPAPAGCVDDAATPQACLDEWVANFDIGPPGGCYVNSYTLSFTGSHHYTLVYGGCPPYSVDATFDQPASFWDDVLVAGGDKVNLKESSGGTYLFNLETGARDRLGFRLPEDKSIEYSGAEVAW